MRPSPLLLQAAKSGAKKSFLSTAPVEVYPLFVAMGFAVVFAGYTLGKKMTFGDLRLSRQGGQPDRLEEHGTIKPHGESEH